MREVRQVRDVRGMLIASMGIVFVSLCTSAVWAQGRGGIASFPAQQRDPAEPAVVAKGRAIYDTECRNCHGPDLRGGERGAEDENAGPAGSGENLPHARR